MRLWPPSTNTMKAMTPAIRATRPSRAMGVNDPHCWVFALSHRSPTARGSPTTMPAKIIKDMPLPIPRSHEERRAGGERQHGHQDESNARVINERLSREVLPRQGQRNRKGLKRA